MPFNPLELLLSMEQEITDNMTRLLAKGADASAEWQAAKLSEVGALRAVNTETVEKYLREIQAGLDEYYRKAGTAAVLNSNIPGLSDVLPETTAANLARVWWVWENATMNSLRNLGMTLIDSAQSTYLNIVYKSTAKMLAGATTLREAIAETATKWLDNGLTGLVDKAGRNWSVEAYAQVVLRSNETQVIWASQEVAFESYGVDLVEISSHIGARPKCAPYQGKVYSRSGSSSKYPPLSSTSIGEPDGIRGCNCGHDIYAYNPGAGKTYKPYGKKENDAAYENSQEQRRLERGIRKAKRRASAAGIAPGSDAEKRAKAKVSAAQAKMREFIADSGRSRRYDREQIY